MLVLGAACGVHAQGRPPVAGPAVPDTGGEAEALRQAVPPAAAASTAARGILDRVRPAMIQIKGFFGTKSSHLVNASPMRARIAVTIGVTIPAVIIAAILWTQTRNENRSPSHIADHDRILPPALLWRRGLPFDGFTAELADLRARADARRAFVEREDPSPDEDDSE